MKRSKIAKTDKFVYGKGFNHRSKNVAESDAAHTLRSGSNTEKESVWKCFKNFFVGVS